MGGEAGLHGLQVLVVEDDFYLAGDTERALQQAGATVLGPAGTEQDALSIIRENTLDCAVLDVNLGEGPTFGAADALREKDVPFILVTGYDDNVIPARFEGVKRLRKPVELRQIVREVARICG
jgi:DNA-binding response OmpR family regulator